MSSVEQRAHDLLAAEYAKACANGEKYPEADEIAIRAIAAALREQPEARGVVDEAMVERARQAYKATKRWSTGEYPEGPIRSVADMNRNDDDAWRAALTAAQQPVQEGGGEVAAWMTPESIAHLAKQNGVAKVDAWNCASGSERVPVYTAPPSAPVGVEDKARAMFEAQADNLAAPWDRQWEPTKDFWRKCAAEALAQQPAQAAPGDADVRELLDAMDNGDDPRPAFIRLRKRYPPKSTPPGDDAAGGG